MTIRLVVGAISAEANRLATHLMDSLLRDTRRARTALPGWPLKLQAEPSKTSLLGFTRMLSSAAEQSGRSHLGLEMASSEQMAPYSIFGDLFLSAPTVGDALQSLVRYFPAVQTGTRVALVHGLETSRFIYDIHDPTVGDRLQDAAYTLGKVSRSLRRSVGEAWTLEQVTLAVPAPRRQEAYRDFFQAPVVFGAQNTSLCFSSRLLEQRIPSADAKRYSDFCGHLERLMPTCNEPELLEDALRSWMAHVVRRGKVTLEHAATDFGVTPRTMQRRLKELGISFQTLLVQVRMETAQHMLTESQLPVTDIAAQLGFSETSAFTRAFRGYTRQSPRAFRQAALAIA